MPSRRSWAWIAGIVMLAGAGYGSRYDLLAARILEQYAAGVPPAAAQEVRLADGATGRLYLPANGAHPPGIVLVHGINQLGADDPRLAALASVLSRHGFAVLTPRIPSLGELRIKRDAVAQIGNAAVWLQSRLDSGPVTVMGFSFAGGLSLLAAADRADAPHIRAVVSIGGYDDLARVASFLVSGNAPAPGGRVYHIAPNEYGVYVYVLLHAAELFPPAQRATAEAALRERMSEHPAAADALAGGLSGGARELVEELFQNRLAEVRPRLAPVMAGDESRFRDLSPAGQVGALRVPVFLLHGSGDDIIPWSEDLWLRRDLPCGDLHASLVTSALDHVNPSARPNWRAEFALIRFWGAVLRAAG